MSKGRYLTKSKSTRSASTDAGAEEAAVSTVGPTGPAKPHQPTRKERAYEQAERLTRKMNPRKNKLPVVAQVDASPEDPFLPLIPAGIMLMPGTARPVFLLKHEASGETLPVWMHPLDASVGLNELGNGAVGSPHGVARVLLERLGVDRVECYFTERVGHHQYVRIEFLHASNQTPLDAEAGETFEGEPVLEPIRVRADEVMSFCLANKARFFSTKSFILQCRVLNEELEKLQEGILNGAANQAFPELEIGSKKTGYMM